MQIIILGRNDGEVHVMLIQKAQPPHHIHMPLFAEKTLGHALDICMQQPELRKG